MPLPVDIPLAFDEEASTDELSKTPGPAETCLQASTEVQDGMDEQPSVSSIDSVLCPGMNDSLEKAAPAVPNDLDEDFSNE
jgi:hypothetical protein